MLFIKHVIYIEIMWDFNSSMYVWLSSNLFMQQRITYF